MNQTAIEAYQYKTLPHQANALSEDQLNRMGAQGWLLVATLPNIVFARRVSDSHTATRFDVPLLLTIKQVSERLGIGRSKVYSLIAAGTIESLKVGRLTRVPRQELEIFIRTMRQD